MPPIATEALTNPFFLVVMAVVAVTSMLTRERLAQLFRTTPVPAALMPICLTFGMMCVLLLGRNRPEYRGFDFARAGSCEILVSGSGALRPNLFNFLAFVPFAIVATVAFRRVLPVVGITALAAVMFEFLQTCLGWGVCEGSDVVLNVLGAVTTAVLVVAAQRAQQVRKELSRRSGA